MWIKSYFLENDKNTLSEKLNCLRCNFFERFWPWHKPQQLKITLLKMIFLAQKFLKEQKTHSKEVEGSFHTGSLFPVLGRINRWKKNWAEEGIVAKQLIRPMSVPLPPSLRPLWSAAQLSRVLWALRDLDPVDLANQADEMLLSSRSPSASLKAIWEQCEGVDSSASLMP